MSTLNINIKPFEEALIKRNAQFSTVIIFRNSDPKRLEPLIRFLYARHITKKRDKRGYVVGIIKPTIFVYKVWKGLLRVVVSPDDKINYEPVEFNVGQQSPIMSSLPAQRVRALPMALQYIDNIMEHSENIIAIFWGLFRYGAVSDQELYELIKFIRNVIFDEKYYVKKHTIILFTENPEMLLDDDTLRNCIVIDIPPSTDDERRAMLSSIAKEMGIRLDNTELEMLVKSMRGLTLHETESVALESLYRYRRFDVLAMTSFKYDIVRKSGILDIEEPQHGFEAVGGYDIIKKFINVNIIKVLKNPKKAERLGLTPPRGILLFGPPGTGKTWFARALAKELSLPFLRLRTENIVSKWYGETSRNIAKALQIAEAVAPAVLFIDEIDRFGRRGHLTEHEESRRAFSILLEWLGDARRKTIVIGTTNRPEDLDEAFIRVGRFDYVIPMLYPDFNARLEILRIHTSVVRKVPLAEDVKLEQIAYRTELWSGAELEELVKRAARKALEEDADVVTMKHFEKALMSFRINFNARRQQLEKYLKLAEEFCNDAEFLEALKKSYEKPSRLDAVLEEIQ